MSTTPRHGEVEEASRGTGLRKAVGDLLVCPYCIGLWSAGALAAGMASAPRTTRFVAGVLTAHSAADFVQLGYSKASS